MRITYMPFLSLLSWARIGTIFYLGYLLLQFPADHGAAGVSRRKMDGVGCTRFAALPWSSIFSCDTSLA